METLENNAASAHFKDEAGKKAAEIGCGFPGAHISYFWTKKAELTAFWKTFRRCSRA
jgi:hypothetical protein